MCAGDCVLESERFDGDASVGPAHASTVVSEEDRVMLNCIHINSDKECLRTH